MKYKVTDGTYNPVVHIRTPKNYKALGFLFYKLELADRHIRIHFVQRSTYVQTWGHYNALLEKFAKAISTRIV